MCALSQGGDVLLGAAPQHQETRATCRQRCVQVAQAVQQKGKAVDAHHGGVGEVRVQHKHSMHAVPRRALINCLRGVIGSVQSF